MWLVYMIAAMVIIQCMLIPARVLGLGWLSYSIIVLGECGFVAWLLPLAFSKAPSFFQAWMTGVLLQTVTGTVSSIVYFKEVPTVKHIIGTVLGLIGAGLLI
jgi:hypothetical protein